jgi:hypothetical protein
MLLKNIGPQKKQKGLTRGQTQTMMYTNELQKNIGSFFEGIILTFYYANPFD